VVAFLCIKRKDRTFHSLKQQNFCCDGIVSLDFDLQKLYVGVARNTFLIPRVIAHFYSPFVGKKKHPTKPALNLCIKSFNIC